MNAAAAATTVCRFVEAEGFFQLVFRCQGCLEEAHDVDCNECQSVTAQTR